MTIEKNVMILDEPVGDEMAEELYATIRKDNIEKIIIENDQIGASVMQVLFCFSKRGKVRSQDEFLGKFFENIIYTGDDI